MLHDTLSTCQIGYRVWRRSTSIENTGAAPARALADARSAFASGGDDILWATVMGAEGVGVGGDVPAVRPLLADEAYRRLKSDILRCRLAPGARVSEQVLSDRLEMGRAPVRTALAQLRREGLVMSVPQVGYEITQVTLRDAQDLFEARELIELHAVGAAAARVECEQLDELAVLASVECTIGDVASVEAYLRANDAFHTRLVLYGTNAYLAGVMTATLERMERLMYLGHLMTPGLGLENDGRHRDIVDCLRARDAERAVHVLTQHLARARERTFTALIASPALQDVNLGAARAYRTVGE
jgi:DNA-binding GntR family transcriptional regulator